MIRSTNVPFDQCSFDESVVSYPYMPNLYMLYVTIIVYYITII